MSDITPIKLPTPIDWKKKKAAAEKHIGKDLDKVMNGVNTRNYISALVEVCAETSMLRDAVASYWNPYLLGENTLSDFFKDWLTYTPTPADPGLYIEYWDYLVNTQNGLILVNNDDFKPWFRKFLNFHGDWINSTSSTGTLKDWMTYGGTTDHPFDIKDYERPDPKSPTGGFKSFNQFFLRNLKGGQRPLCKSNASKAPIVAPCDGGIFYLSRGEESENTRFDLPGKSDEFDLLDAVPGYGPYFQGGAILDILLWFTDYHHFHAPVDGKVIHHGLYRGSYNYDFGDYDPDDFYAPNLPASSDRVGWYEKLGKHQRYVWIINTEEFGLVAMIAIGFWGVGSIVNALKDKAEIKRGQYMGHFGYGGSSIVLAFHRDLDIDFKVGYKPVQDADRPLQMNVRACLT
jgi:phosphatidylserine decarboxylase